MKYYEDLSYRPKWWQSMLTGASNVFNLAPPPRRKSLSEDFAELNTQLEHDLARAFHRQGWVDKHGQWTEAGRAKFDIKEDEA